MFKLKSKSKSKSKRVVSVVVVLFMLIALLVSCAPRAVDQPEQPAEQQPAEQQLQPTVTPVQEEPEKQLPPMTTENITLTYASWENSYLNEFLVERFMEKYPNITVNLVHIDFGAWNDGLLNLAAAQNLPDAFWYLGNADIGLRNGWFGDMTEFFENDPETETIFETMRMQGYFDGERKFAQPSKLLPFTVFLDKGIFEKLNVPMPSPDWTYDEMIELMQRMTVPEQGIFGYNTFTQLVTMAPIVNADALGEFGWDGERYDLTGYWAKALTQHAEFVRTGVHAPFYNTDAAEAAFGDRHLWAGASGRVAIQLDAWWTLGLFSSPEFIDRGINWVPFPVPRGANATTNRKPAFVDFGAISSATEHPREAYELLKFMGWGREGWEHKLYAYENLTREDGQRVFIYPDNIPMIDVPQIWEGFKRLLPQTPYVASFLERAREPIPLGGASQAGFQTFLDEVYFGGEHGNIEAAIIEGRVNAFDVAPDLTEKLNLYRQQAIEEIMIIYPR